MSVMRYLQSAAKDLHKNLRQAMTDLNDEQLHFRPLDRGSPIAFIIWHEIRTEDVVLNAFLQKKAPLWDAEGWAEKTGVTAKGQGTGMPAEQAASLRIPNLGEFRNYMEAVFKGTDAYLEGLQEPVLWEEREFPMLGKRTVMQVIGGVVLQHGAGHLGEIWYLKGLQGLKGSPI
jgi:hypothetical protein